MKPNPAGWPRISSAVYYDESKKAIEWLCRAFGFEVRILIEGDEGRVEHSELTYGDGVMMVADASRSEKFPQVRSPRAVGGGNTQNLLVYVDDVDAHCAHARAQGAKILSEPKTSDYGEDYWSDRTYECADLEGHHWWFSQRLREWKKIKT